MAIRNSNSLFYKKKFETKYFLLIVVLFKTMSSTTYTKAQNDSYEHQDHTVRDLCWFFDENPHTHREWRYALGKYELTCDVCHKNEYPEQYTLSPDNVNYG